MANVQIDVPDYSMLLIAAVEATKVKTLTNIEGYAKDTAPVDTGFYRNNIQTSLSESAVVANAEYSAPIEYGVNGTKRQPNPIMRMAGKKAQTEVKSILLKEFL